MIRTGQRKRSGIWIAIKGKGSKKQRETNHSIPSVLKAIVVKVPEVIKRIKTGSDNGKETTGSDAKKRSERRIKIR